ncbi:hypothetical protein ScPMuIL_001202 [Solemya velum]
MAECKPEKPSDIPKVEEMSESKKNQARSRNNLSNRALKRLRGKERRMRMSTKTKPLTKNQDPGFGEDLFNETDYYFQNGLRKVYPYYYDFSTYVKKRWIGRTVIDVFLSEFRSEEPENYIKAVESGMFIVNGRAIGTSYKLRHNDFLSHKIHRHENPVIGSPIEILADTEDLIVVNKPPSIPCHPCGRYRYNSIPFILGKEYGYSNLRNIYRLDRLTSGVLICTKTAEKTRQLEDQIARRQVQKEYVCRVVGKFPDGIVKCDQALEVMCHKVTVWKVAKSGKPSSTTFERLSFNGKTSVVKCMPHTGRTHQIRVHLQFLGHPIVNDPFYNSEAFGPERGKGGKYHTTEEEITKAIIKRHNIGLWIDGENPLFKSRLETMRQHKQQNDELPETDKLSDSDKPMDSEKLTCPDDQSTTGTPACSGKICDNVDIEESCTTRTIKTPREGFDENKWFPDENCDSCKKRFIDPGPEDLVMYLHALKYKGPDWEYMTSVPDWAKEDWTDDST